ncbi:MAG: LTXXQ domain protein, partial [Pseudomonas sp.]
LMGEQRAGRQHLVKKYLDKLPAADQKAMKDEMAAAKQKTQADIRALLKPDQQKKFDEMAKKRAERQAEWQQFQAWKAQQPQKAQ